MTVNEVFAKNLRTRMEIVGMSQCELARRLDSCHVAVWKWCNGKSMPHVPTYLTLVKVLGVTAEALMRDYDKEF